MVGKRLWCEPHETSASLATRAPLRRGSAFETVMGSRPRSAMMCRVRPRASTGVVLVRSVVVSALSVLLGVVAHVSAGGLLPSAWTLPVMLAMSMLGTSLVLERVVSRRFLTALLVAGQTSVHVALTALAGHGDPSSAAGTQADAAVGSVLRDAGAHLLADLTPAHAPMAVAHLLAAAGVGWLLSYGERGIWTVLGLVARVSAHLAAPWCELLRPVVLAMPRPVRVHVDLQSLRPQRLLLSDHRLRGPPVLSSAR